MNKSFKYSFLAGNFDKTRGPLWTVSSPAVYDSRGQALFFAHNACRKHGCPPEAVVVKVRQETTYGQLDFAM